MASAKPVQLSNGRTFAKAGDAREFFKAVLSDGVLNVRLVGVEHEMVDVLFRDYCRATNWTMPGNPVGYRRDWNQAHGSATRGFFVIYDNGTEDDFSYIKAVRAIANK